jgi:hypothetical protein
MDVMREYRVNCLCCGKQTFVWSDGTDRGLPPTCSTCAAKRPVVHAKWLDAAYLDAVCGT